MAREISAFEAKSEAQRIAFSPIVFQTVMTMRELGMMSLIAKHKQGIEIETIAKELKISPYGVTVLVEMAACADIVTLNDNKVKLTNVGFVLNSDRMTQVNLNFVKDICYRGAHALTQSILDGKPRGLPTLGDWKTLYEGLSILPDKEKKSWFEFDHYYSDDAFPEAIEIIFKEKTKMIFDIGGNTGKFTMLCCESNPEVQVKILDLPVQLNVAHQNISARGYANRVSFEPVNMLSDETVIPQGADVIWMSQFLDCFSEDEIVRILSKVKSASSPATRIFILEPFVDNQKYEAASFSLAATSLYFTTIANGNSKMYTLLAMKKLIQKAGLRLTQEYPCIAAGSNTLLECRVG